MHHADHTNFGSIPKKEAYQEALEACEALFLDNWVANCANLSSLLWHLYKSQPAPQANVNWAGVYTRHTHDELILGPFQGKVACQVIKFGKGVCGAAAQAQKTQLVPDVHKFPGHIACDGDTQSEIVVPIITESDNIVRGVIDIDCVDLNGFDQVDQEYLEKIAALLAKKSHWNN